MPLAASAVIAPQTLGVPRVYISSPLSGAIASARAQHDEGARDPGRARRRALRVMDLMDPASIDAFAKGFLAGNEKLDILINCAGVMANPLTRAARGYESQFSTNVLGHFQLTSTRLE